MSIYALLQSMASWSCMVGGDIDQSSKPSVRVPVAAMVASVGGLAAATTVVAGLSEQVEVVLLVLINQEPDR